MYRYFKAKVTENIPLDNKNNLLSIKPLESVIKHSPGQFYMIEVGNSYDPLLKRPFSYFRNKSGNIQFIYSVRGKGTLLMKKFKKGNILNIIGPLGTGYPKPGDNLIPLLIAGGTGVASILSLAEKLSKKAYLFYGAMCKNELIILDETNFLENKKVICINCTDDGSFGEKGTVVDILKEFLISQSSDNNSYILYGCGPNQMLEKITKIALDNKIKGFISLEENMACGIGACQGCVVKTIYGYKRVCKEGPVFPIEEIVW